MELRQCVDSLFQNVPASAAASQATTQMGCMNGNDHAQATSNDTWTYITRSGVGSDTITAQNATAHP
ncbi:MAG TPA: hypothetical protein DDW52_12110 [Planctomycetaceae bacterium]|nr:hypothetical protein [Planctomycetaceae bacterium]